MKCKWLNLRDTVIFHNRYALHATYVSRSSKLDSSRDARCWVCLKLMSKENNELGWRQAPGRSTRRISERVQGALRWPAYFAGCLCSCELPYFTNQWPRVECTHCKRKPNPYVLESELLRTAHFLNQWPKIESTHRSVEAQSRLFKSLNNSCELPVS